MLSMTTVAFAQNITFESSSQNFQGMIFSEIAVGEPDVNGFSDICLDGAADSNGSSMYSFVYNNNGDGTLDPSTPFIGTSNGVILYKDFDKDGDNDYAKWGVTDVNGNHIGILMRNNGDGTYTDVTPEDFESLYYARGVAGDFDNDNDDDILVHGYNDETGYITYYYENHGALNFTLKQTFTGIAGGNVIAGDIDHNGFVDVIHSGGNAAQLYMFALRNDNGWFTEELISDELDPMGDGAMEFIDINGDGYLDYAGNGSFASGYGTDFKLNDGTGHFPGQKLPVPFQGMNGATLLAFNADNQGKEELLVAGRNLATNINMTKLYKINEDNSLSVIKSFADPFFGGDAVAVDVNNDGFLDLFRSGNIGGPFPFEEGKTSLEINTTPLSVENFTKDSVVLYPNPTHGIVNVELPSDVFVTHYRVTDMLGKVMNVSHNGTQIDLSGLQAGMYLLTLDTEPGSVNQRIIKQ